MLEKSDIRFIKEIIDDESINGNKISFKTYYSQSYVHIRLRYLLNKGIIKGEKVGRRYNFFIDDELKMHIKNYYEFEKYIEKLEDENEKL